MADSASVVVPWKRIAIASFLLSVASLAAVAVIASLNGSDALSTVALALAILSFVSQLIIFSIQSWTSSEQLKQAEALNSETKSLVAEVRTRIAGTHQMVQEQHDQVVRLMAGRFEREIAKASVSDTEERAQVDVRSVVDRVITTTVQGQTHVPEVEPTPQWARSWPSASAAEAALEVLSGLSDSVPTFAINLSQALSGLTYGDLEEFALSFVSSDMPALEAGLIRYGPAREGDEEARTVVVTKRGLEVGRVLAAKWPPPESYPAALSTRLWELRQVDPEAVDMLHPAESRFEGTDDWG